MLLFLTDTYILEPQETTMTVLVFAPAPDHWLTSLSTAAAPGSLKVGCFVACEPESPN